MTISRINAARAIRIFTRKPKDQCGWPNSCNILSGPLFRSIFQIKTFSILFCDATSAPQIRTQLRRQRKLGSQITPIAIISVLLESIDQPDTDTQRPSPADLCPCCDVAQNWSCCHCARILCNELFKSSTCMHPLLMLLQHKDSIGLIGRFHVVIPSWMALHRPSTGCIQESDYRARGVS